jgi:hypothetical protein
MRQKAGESLESGNSGSEERILSSVAASARSMIHFLGVDLGHVTVTRMLKTNSLPVAVALSQVFRTDESCFRVGGREPVS